MTVIRSSCLLALLCTAAFRVTPVHAQSAEPSQREGYAAERGAAEARYGERERACRDRFVVTSCVDDAKRERRETLTRLKREQNQLDDRLRKARAAERTESIRQREAMETQRARQAATHEPRESAKRAPSDGHPVKSGDGGAASTPARRGRPQGAHPAPPSAALRGEQEARSRATFDAAHREAEAHRAEVEQRNAQRASKRKGAAPLPLPASELTPAVRP